ncbi:hypothetical protein ABPG75_012186 [Micractinium tetrahymenae]
MEQHQRLFPSTAGSPEAAAGAAAAVDPAADPELGRLQQQLAALPAMMSAAPLRLRRELLELLRRQRSYVGVRQQVGLVSWARLAAGGPSRQLWRRHTDQHGRPQQQQWQQQQQQWQQQTPPQALLPPLSACPGARSPALERLKQAQLHSPLPARRRTTNTELRPITAPR